MRVEDLLAQTHRLPNVPQAVRQLIQQLNNPEADYDEIATRIGADQTLTLRVLRMVNSAHFGLSRQVSSLEEAVVMMGMERLKTLVIASGLAGSVNTVDGLDIADFWGQSFRVAIVSQYLGEHSTEVSADMAFTAGLIHNIGRLLLHLAAPEQASRIQQVLNNEGGDRYTLEQQILGFNSLEAGSALIERWKFPPELATAILQHHKPLAWPETSSLAATVHLAELVNAAACEGWPMPALYQAMPLEVIHLAGLQPTIRDSVDIMLALEFACDTTVS
ncbi:MAG: HDOD domain-containing protein [Marinobacterium sp.]|nr:HDOD domain-containing protein [Marinobacterium sp.]